jgi:multisubunit Na+/H+ antiporter MnhE subunit
MCLAYPILGYARTRMSRLLVVWLTWWVILAGLYLLIDDSVLLPELVVGAIAAAVGATGATLVHRERRVLLRGDVRWLRALWRPLAWLVGDLWPLARALVRRGGTGAFVEIPFDATSDGPRDTAKRAATEALGSLAPNTIVVRIDTDRGVVVAHQLVPTSDPARRATPL